MFTGNHICTSFKVQLLQGVHDMRVGGHVFKLALYAADATLTAATAAYTTSSEIPAGGGYATGGMELTQVDPVSLGTTAAASFEDLTLPGATLSARGALIYNSSVAGNPAVLVLDFGGTKSVSGQDFTITFPALTADSALVRVA